MQGLANKVADGNCEMLANSMNEFFVSVSEHLPRLNVNNEVFAVEGELPDEFIISIQTTFKALRYVKDSLTRRVPKSCTMTCNAPNSVNSDSI